MNNRSDTIKTEEIIMNFCDMQNIDIDIEEEENINMTIPNSTPASYTPLTNKPQINGVTLEGNKTSEELKIIIPDISDLATKDELEEKADKDNVYTKTETDNLLSDKANKNELNNKQDKLVSGTNIKTINGESVLGSGNIVTPNTTYTAGDGIDITNEIISVDDTIALKSELPNMTNYYNKEEINTALNNKVDKINGKGLSTNDFTNEDKSKLDGIQTGANKTIVDNALSNTSENPVQNKIVTAEFGLKADKSDTYTKNEVDNLIPDTSDFITKDVNNLTNYTTTTEMNTLLNNKVDKVVGKGLSENDFTTAEKTKLSEIEARAEVNKIDAIKVNGTTQTITNKEVDIEVPVQATESKTGTIKLNPSDNIGVNDNGQLVVGGRLGQTAEGGLYSPASATPKLVDKNALLISGMSGLSVGNGALALLRGAGVTVKSAPAGTTEYHVANTYLNRLQCVGLQYSGAVCIINEDAEPTGDYSNILSCTINGASFVPHTGADDPNNDIIITVDKTCNPNTTVTQIRCYTSATKSSSFYAGQMVGGYSGLANVIVGQSAFTNTSNVVAMIAAQSYNNGNGNALFGRYHNSAKNRWFMSGTGHDNTNGRTESGAVVGQYSVINPDTLFAVGNGNDQLNRSNAFEVTESGVDLSRVNNLEIVDKNLAPAFNTTNYSKTSAITIVGDIATFPDNATALYLTKKSPAIPVAAGEVIEWSYEVRKTADTVVCMQGLNLMKTNATGGSATNNLVRNEPASSYTTSWQTVKGTFTVPSGMEYMTPRLQKTMPSGSTATSGAYEVRNLKITRPGQANLIMSSPNGTRFKIVVDDNGNLSTVLL